MGAIASQITSLTIVYLTVYSGADQRKHRSSAPLAFVRWIHRGLVNSAHKWPVTRKMFPFVDVIMTNLVIPAWTGDELWRGQARGWRTHTRTHGQTDAGNDNTRRPRLASDKNENDRSKNPTTKPFWWWNQNNPASQGQYHSCRCLGLAPNIVFTMQKKAVEGFQPPKSPQCWDMM